MDQLAAIPEPEGVTLYRVAVQAVWRKPEGLTVLVAHVGGSAGVEGRGVTYRALLPVALDDAHDLSWQGPKAFVWPDCGDRRGVIRWQVNVVGFVEPEAQAAFDAVCAAIER